jgi:hypothetical protein
MGKGAGSCSDRPAIAFSGAAPADVAELTNAIDLQTAFERVVIERDLWNDIALDTLLEELSCEESELEAFLDDRVSQGLLTKTVRHRNDVYIVAYKPTGRAKGLLAHERWRGHDEVEQAVLTCVAMSPRPLLVPRIARDCNLDEALVTAACRRLVAAGALQQRQRNYVRGYLVSNETRVVLKGLAQLEQPAFASAPMPPSWRPAAPVEAPAFTEQFWRSLDSTWAFKADDVDGVSMGLTADELQGALEHAVQTGLLQRRGTVSYGRVHESGVTENVSAHYTPTDAGFRLAAERQIETLEQREQDLLYLYVLHARGAKAQLQVREVQQALGVSAKEASAALGTLKARRVLHKTTEPAGGGSTRSGWSLTSWGRSFHGVMSSQ